MLKMLHGKVWFPSLYQEVPCSNRDIQKVDLDPAYPWRFFSPNFPSSKGYPHRSDCTWHFVIEPKKVENVTIQCDHINIVGNFFNECSNGDYLSIRHEDDEYETNAPGRLCGDLTSWVPLESSIHIDYTEQKQRFLRFLLKQIGIKIIFLTYYIFQDCCRIQK